MVREHFYSIIKNLQLIWAIGHRRDAPKKHEVAISISTIQKRVTFVTNPYYFQANVTLSSLHVLLKGQANLYI